MATWGNLVQLVAWTLFLLSHQLAENGALVEGKVRNRVQKWQQRTWKSRFGSALRRDWKTAFGGAGRTHHRSRYGLSPAETDFFTSDSVPNAYSNYHYRRYGASRPKSRAGSGRRVDSPTGLSEGPRPKRHTHGRPELASELKDYLDPLDLMMLDDDPNGELFPLAMTELGHEYGVHSEAEPDEDGQLVPFEKAGAPSWSAADGGGDKKLKEYKIVLHRRDLSGRSFRPGVCVAGLICTLLISTFAFVAPTSS